MGSWIRYLWKAFNARPFGAPIPPFWFVGAAFGLVRLIDIPIDAAIGVAMDRTRTGFGRYRIWMLGGAPILMAGT